VCGGSCSLPVNVVGGGGERRGGPRLQTLKAR
jgi:hypothetical protein